MLDLLSSITPVVYAIFSPILLLAQAAGEEGVQVTFTPKDLPWLLGAGVVIVGILAWVVRYLHNSVAEQWQEAEREEEHFEQELLNEIGAEPAEFAAPNVAPKEPMAEPERPNFAPPAASAFPATPPPGDARIDAPPADLDELVKRLQKLTILGDREGVVKLPIPPDAPIYRLRRGGLALLLPRMETEAFLAHQTRRFDYVFALTAGGEVVVVSRLQNQINALRDAPQELR